MWRQEAQDDLAALAVVEGDRLPAVGVDDLVGGVDRPVVGPVGVGPAAAAVLAAATLLPRAHADSQIDRGKYLVTLAGCNDCHTPGYFFGKPDMARYLGGS